MDTYTDKHTNDFWGIAKDSVYIVLACFIMTFAINVFLLPNKLSTGGASGIATIFYYIFHIPMGISIVALNLPLFIISLIKLDKSFSIKAVITTLLLSIMLDVIKFGEIITYFKTDLFISSVFGGILMGIASSLILKAGASSGGSDLLAQIIYKLKSTQSVSDVMFIIDSLIILSIVVVFKNINLGLYSIISIFVSKRIIDVIFEGIYYTKIVRVITDNPRPIIDDIFVKLNRGATITQVTGAYTGKEFSQVTVIVTLHEIVQVKKIVSAYDNRALIYISDANEVLGKGFKEL